MRPSEIEHLLGRAFEQPAAAHGEQGVADKRDAVLVEDKSDVAEGMARDFDHAADMVAQPDLVAFAQRDVAAGDVAALAGRKSGRRSLP